MEGGGKHPPPPVLHQPKKPGANRVNTLNQKGPLTQAGSSPYCVLLEVVSEDIVLVIKFVSHIFCLQRKITLPFDPSIKIC